jgi:hypothetical protein
MSIPLRCPIAFVRPRPGIIIGAPAARRESNLDADLPDRSAKRRPQIAVTGAGWPVGAHSMRDPVASRTRSVHLSGNREVAHRMRSCNERASVC